MLKTGVLRLTTLAAAVALLLVAPLAGAHVSGDAVQKKTVDGYRYQLSAAPTPLAGEATTLKVSVICAKDGRDVAGDLKVTVTKGGQQEYSKDFTVVEGNDVASIPITFQESGDRTVKLVFQRSAPDTACEGSKETSTASFSLHVDEENLLPAPGLALSGLGVLAAAVLVARRKDA